MRESTYIERFAGDGWHWASQDANDWGNLQGEGPFMVWYPETNGLRVRAAIHDARYASMFGDFCWLSGRWAPKVGAQLQSWPHCIAYLSARPL